MLTIGARVAAIVATFLMSSNDGMLNGAEARRAASSAGPGLGLKFIVFIRYGAVAGVLLALGWPVACLVGVSAVTGAVALRWLAGRGLTWTIGNTQSVSI
jgi:hypothetical protein